MIELILAILGASFAGNAPESKAKARNRRLSQSFCSRH